MKLTNKLMFPLKFHNSVSVLVTQRGAMSQDSQSESIKSSTPSVFWSMASSLYFSVRYFQRHPSIQPSGLGTYISKQYVLVNIDFGYIFALQHLFFKMDVPPFHNTLSRILKNRCSEIQPKLNLTGTVLCSTIDVNEPSSW